jgi:hypothetical protein
MNEGKTGSGGVKSPSDFLCEENWLKIPINCGYEELLILRTRTTPFVYVEYLV